MKNATIIYDTELCIDVPDNITELDDILALVKEPIEIGRVAYVSLNDENGDQIKEWLL